mmetsp:Transcript_6941/g.6756  ORF Transcript_6941/g.6756 Transcript_6941/m.6756 type:complete len:88 (+) Transcript_6941:1324-1587(+)
MITFYHDYSRNSSHPLVLRVVSTTRLVDWYSDTNLAGNRTTGTATTTTICGGQDGLTRWMRVVLPTNNGDCSPLPGDRQLVARKKEA